MDVAQTSHHSSNQSVFKLQTPWYMKKCSLAYMALLNKIARSRW